MAQLIVAAAGAAIGYATFGVGTVALGMSGAQLGWMAGSLVGSAFAPTQKSQGPRLDDLKVSTSSYGTPIPYIAGHPRVSGQIVWASEKREIATTESAGKGGGGSEYTTYTYEVDVLILLTDNEIGGIARIWNNGELAFDGTTVKDNLWTRMTTYSGSASQLPDATYEAAVGTANAPAYRGRGSVFIESLQLGGSGQIPNLTFEVFLDGVIETADTLLVFNASSGVGDALVDESSYARTMAEWVGGNPSWITKAAGYSAETQSMYFSNSSDDARYIEVNDMPSPENYDFGTGPFCVEAWCKQEVAHALSTILETIHYDNGSKWGILLGTNHTGKFWMCVGNQNTGGVGQYPVISTITPVLNTWYHLAGTRVGGVLTLWVNGEQAATGAIDPAYDVADSVGSAFKWSIGSNISYAYYNWRGWIGGMRAVKGNPVYTEPFTPPTGLMTEYQSSTGVADDSYLTPTVSTLCLAAGLQASQFDVTALSTITRPVHAMAIGQVSSARAVLDMLASAYHFDAVLSDKIYFKPRGSASVATLTFDEFGVAVDGSSGDPLPLTQANELEIPAQLAITFSNVDGDYQTDTQYSDRLLTGMESTSATTLPLGFTASEGKQIADALLLDKAVSALTTSVSLSVTRAALEPLDVVLLTGDDGSTYRMRIVKKADAAGVTTLSCVQDDASVFTQAGTTVGGTASQTTVLATATTAMELMDIALLRDADNTPGFYVAVMGSAANWSHCAIYSSIDDLTYSLVTTLTGQTALGACTTVLGDWTGGNVFDETSSVTVDVGAIQQLASVTRDDILTNIAANAALIGSELIQYRTATLVSEGVYTLSGLLRGRRGTEWASTGHVADEVFVALNTSGMRYLLLQSGDLGSAKYYKAVSAGQRLSDVTAQPITPAGVSLECFSPVNARANRDSTDTVLTWTRRTRLSTRLTGALPINAPLGETTESYEVEVWDSGYTTLKRTITASTETATYTSAQQATDFGGDQTVLYLKIFQLSATVGRGYPLTVSV